MSEQLNADIQFLKGVGPARAKLFNKLGVNTVRDMIHFFPRDYWDMTKTTAIMSGILGQQCAVIATVTSPIRTVKIRAGMEVFKTKASDISGSMDIVLFNRRYAATTLQPGKTFLFFGKMEGNLLRREMVNPYFEQSNIDGNGKILPLYRLTEGLTQTMIRKTIGAALESCLDFDEVITEKLRQTYGLAGREFAIKNIHNPLDEAALNSARKRLVFEELLIFSLALQQLKCTEKQKTQMIIDPSVDLSPYYNALGFTLTQAQKRTIHECVADYSSGFCQNRLIQGDVGCGKTAVAAALVYLMAKNSVQSALMAPTEVLATQHYNSLGPLFEKLGITVALLTGGTPAGVRKELLKKLASGEINLLIGTHALISEGVSFKNLAIVITDEQHRFGVKQRELLQKKGSSPHMIVMSATPIPRTLALILYAELDISVIDTLPPGRKPVHTYAVDSSYKDRVYNFAYKNIAQGRQAYVICARAEDDEESELKSVRELCSELKKKMPAYQIEYLHGKLSTKEKDRILLAFTEGKIDILVSTTVVEVGINVPNATVMVIENAERFGLSQLHQLRGRVGRGADQSHCILISDAKGENALARLEIMAKTNDGFEISQKDLDIRGPGEFFGTRQAGLVRFKIADLMNDMQVVLLSRDAANEILKGDPLLSNSENAPLKAAVTRVLTLYNESSI